MSLLRSLETALANLRANKLRSALTMLGVIIGVSAVIVMVAIVEGARAKVVSEFERLGSKLIIIVYEPEQSRLHKEAVRVDNLTMDDVRAIRGCDLIQSISAELPVGEDIPATYRDRESKCRPIGVQPDYARLRNVSVVAGRFLTWDDEDNWAKVCVIGDKIRAELFPNEDPIGKDIELRGITTTVVGVLAPKGRTGGEDADRALLAPITTIQKRYVGREIVGMIWAQPRDSSMVNAAMDQVWQRLMRRHNNAPGFRVDSQENILNAIGRVLNIFGLVIGSVAGLALLVGGIGIMNIMLVSVTERTREIGIRKAVGAKRRDILVQFLIEAATLSGTGGLAGIGLGGLVAWIVGAVSKRLMKGGINNDPGIPVHLPLWSIVGAFAFSAFVGVFFGIYPAIRAARLDPIEALRHE
ncbi:MAG: ABC transporter permease [Chthonomonadales bacterium]